MKLYSGVQYKIKNTTFFMIKNPKEFNPLYKYTIRKWDYEYKAWTTFGYCNTLQEGYDKIEFYVKEHS